MPARTDPERGRRLLQRIVELGAVGRDYEAEWAHVQGAAREAIATLMPLERAILELRFGWRDEHKHTVEEVSEQFRMSNGRVRIVENGARKALRSRLAYLLAVGR